MSVTINIAGKQAVLADGKWRSADPWLVELLNDHLVTIMLPAHYPVADRERLAAQAAVRDFHAHVVRTKPVPQDHSRMPDGRLKVY